MSIPQFFCDDQYCRVSTSLSKFAKPVACDDSYLHALFMSTNDQEVRYEETVGKLYDKACKTKNYDHGAVVRVGRGVYDVYKEYPVFAGKLICERSLPADAGATAAAEVLLKNFILGASLKKMANGFRCPVIVDVVESMTELNAVFFALDAGAELAVVNIQFTAMSGAIQRDGYIARYTDHEDGVIALIVPDDGHDCALKYLVADNTVEEEGLCLLYPASLMGVEPGADVADDLDSDLSTMADKMGVATKDTVAIQYNLFANDDALNVSRVTPVEHPPDVIVESRSMMHLLDDWLSIAPLSGDIYDGVRYLYDCAWQFKVFQPLFAGRSLQYESAISSVYVAALTTRHPRRYSIFNVGTKDFWNKLAAAMCSLVESMRMHMQQAVKPSDMKIEHWLMRAIDLVHRDCAPEPVRDFVSVLVPLIAGLQRHGTGSAVVEMAVKSVFRALCEDMGSKKFTGDSRVQYTRRYVCRMLGLSALVVFFLDLSPIAVYPYVGTSLVEVATRVRKEGDTSHYFEYFSERIGPIFTANGLFQDAVEANGFGEGFSRGYCYLNLFKPEYWRAILVHTAFSTEIAARELYELLVHYGRRALTAWIYVAKIKAFKANVVLHLYPATMGLAIADRDGVVAMRSYEYVLKVCYARGVLVEKGVMSLRQKKLHERQLAAQRREAERRGFGQVVGNLGLLA